VSFNTSNAAACEELRIVLWEQLLALCEHVVLGLVSEVERPVLIDVTLRLHLLVLILKTEHVHELCLFIFRNLRQ